MDPAELKSYADRIHAHWQKTTKSIMEVARLCGEANKRLSAKQKKRLIKLLPFSGPTFSKLAQIGYDQRLRSNRVASLLPPSYSIIYSVTQLKDNELHTAIKEGVIQPKLKRADLAEWLEQKKFRYPSAPSEKKIKLPDIFFAAIRLLKELPPEEVKRLDAMLDQIRLDFDAEIIRPRDRQSEKEWKLFHRKMGQRYAKITDYMRKGVRRIVREMEASAKKGHPKRGYKPYTWGFTWDETYVPPDADEPWLSRVLATIGRDDELERLRKKASDKFPEPTSPEPYPWQVESPEEVQRNFELLAKQIRKPPRKKPDFSKWK